MIITLVMIIHITKNKMWHNRITIPINTFGCELGIKPHIYSFGKIIIYNYYAQITDSDIYYHCYFPSFESD